MLVTTTLPPNAGDALVELHELDATRYERLGLIGEGGMGEVVCGIGTSAVR
jgi:hypothetical protein